MWSALLMVAAAMAQTQAVAFTRGFVNVYALVGDDGIVLVDTHYPGREKWILRKLRKAGLRSEDVTAILLTHAHSDHAGSAAALSKQLDVPVIVGGGDAYALSMGEHGRPQPQGLQARFLSVTIPKHYDGVSEAVMVSEPLPLNAYGVHAIAEQVGGHTDGSLIVRLPDDVVLSGDLVRGSLTAHRRPRVHFFHEDRLRAHQAVRALLADGTASFLPSHGGQLDAERVERWLERVGRQDATEARNVR